MQQHLNLSNIVLSTGLSYQLPSEVEMVIWSCQH